MNLGRLAEVQMGYPFRSRLEHDPQGDVAVIQDVASYEQTQETLALLKILALGSQEIEAGLVKPVADVVARLRAKRAAE